jgi:hypothetical protein
MYVEQGIRVVAGLMILASVSVGFIVNKWARYWAAFVGANLLQFGFTKICPLEYILIKAGMPPTPCIHCAVSLYVQKMAVENQENTFLQVFKKLDMTRIIRIVAGTMVLTSALLGIWVSEWALVVTVFVGANLLQFGFTNLCPLATILRYAGITDNETDNGKTIPVPTGEDM